MKKTLARRNARNAARRVKHLGNLERFLRNNLNRARRLVRGSSIESRSHLTVTAGRRSTKGTGGSFARPGTKHVTDSK